MKTPRFTFEDTRVLGYTFTMAHTSALTLRLPRSVARRFVPGVPSVGPPRLPSSPRAPSIQHGIPLLIHPLIARWQVNEGFSKSLAAAVADLWIRVYLCRLCRNVILSIIMLSIVCKALFLVVMLTHDCCSFVCRTSVVLTNKLIRLRAVYNICQKWKLEYELLCICKKMCHFFIYSRIC